MSRIVLPNMGVGNDFTVAASAVTSEPVLASTPSLAPMAPVKTMTFDVPIESRRSLFGYCFELLHRYSLGAFALLFLLVASSGIEVAATYWSAHIENAVKPALAARSTAPTIAGFNLTVASNQLQSKLQIITDQPTTLSVGSNTVSISPATIRGWLQISANAAKPEAYIHVDSGSIISSLSKLATSYVVTPVNQVSVTHTDGISPSGIILAGSNGTKLSNPGSLTTQAQQLAKTVMNGAGLQFSTPLQTVPFQAVTPAAFGKLLEADVTTDRLYAYQNGQLVNTFLSTDGKPSTPTPLGEFHIWAKSAMQTMVGPGYVQPNVPWINYFDYSGDAVHGNYWRPASVFGVTNTSHGCVSVPVSQAEWIYDWAPIGTTVITHA